MDNQQRLVTLLGRLVSPAGEPLRLSEIFELIGLMRGYWLESDPQTRTQILNRYVSRLPRAIEAASFPSYMDPGSIKLEWDQYPLGDDGALSFYVKYLPLDDRLSHRWLQVQFSFLPEGDAAFMCTLTLRDEESDYLQEAFFPLASQEKDQSGHTSAVRLGVLLSVCTEYFLNKGHLPPHFSLSGSN